MEYHRGASYLTSEFTKDIFSTYNNDIVMDEETPSSSKSTRSTNARKSSRTALIKRRLPSKRSAINEFQATHFCDLCTLLIQRTLEYNGIRDIEKLPTEGWEKFIELQEYNIFTTGVYACGFVCADMNSDVDLNMIQRSPADAIRRFNLLQLRHYVHTLMRSERASFGYGSVLYDALRAGVLDELVNRIARDTDLYENI